MNAHAGAKRNSGPLDQYNSIGIILAGGGAKGPYQAGALKAIHDFLSQHNAHHKVRMIAGTSIGSWNALFWLAGLVGSTHSEICGLEKWWSNLSFLELVRPTFYFPGIRNYFLSASPWRQSFERIFATDEDTADRLKQHIEQPNGEGSIHFYLTRSNVERAQLEVTTNQSVDDISPNLPITKWKSGVHRVKTHRAQTIGDLRDAVFSSMDLPPVFKYWKVGDSFYEDGGVIDNLPIQFGTECEQCDLLFILPLNATFSRNINHRSIIRRMSRVLDVRQGVLERNSFKMVYLYNELAALRQRTEELEGLAQRALTALADVGHSPDPSLIGELQQILPIPAASTATATQETPPADRALVRRHQRVQVFSICPAPKLAINTMDFWKRNESGKVFRRMRDATTIELKKFFSSPPEYIRMALVQPHGDVTYLEEF
jgi:predicted acylesterase/phospholipase RssA